MYIPQYFYYENIDLNKNEKLQETIYAIIDSDLLKILVVLIKYTVILQIDL